MPIRDRAQLKELFELGDRLSESAFIDLIDSLRPVYDTVVGEVPSGLVDGSNATYYSAYNFAPLTVEVYLNGLKQTRITDFNTVGLTQIFFLTSPLAGDHILINYTKV